MLGLAGHLGAGYRSIFLPFEERGRSRAFVEQARRAGFSAFPLENDKPRFGAMIGELAGRLRTLNVDILVTHQYKANIIGLIAARKANIPVVSVSHGWTGESRRQRFYDAFDRFVLRSMDAVVCVSEAQARKVRRAGVRSEKVVVIPNAVDREGFRSRSRSSRIELETLFARRPRRIVGAAGRLSAEKGFDQLVAAAALVAPRDRDVGFVVFGDGPERAALGRAIAGARLDDRFILTGFRRDVARLLPALDVVVLSSHTEGMPVVILEAMAAGVPVVATAVGGTPEVVVHGETGYLTAPGEVAELASRIEQVLASSELRRTLGNRGRQRATELFNFDRQSDAYRKLFASTKKSLGGRLPAEHLRDHPRPVARPAFHDQTS